MGFIEGLHREKEERKRQLLEQQEKQRVLREEEERLRHPEVYKERRALEYYLTSNFPRLMREIRDNMDQRGRPSLGGRHEPGSLIQTLVWDYKSEIRHGKDETVYVSTWTGIEVKFSHDGTATVSGNFSTTLSLQEWQNRPDLQERALEVAFKNPKNYRGERREPVYKARGVDFSKKGPPDTHSMG